MGLATPLTGIAVPLQCRKGIFMRGTRTSTGLRAHPVSLAVAALGLGLALPAGATSLSLHLTGVAVPEDPGILADVTLAFDFDPICTTGCTLRIGLTYNDVNGSGGLHSSAQALTGVVWDAAGTLVVSRSGSSLIAPALVGSHGAEARSDLPDLTRDGVSGDDVTGHWAFRDDFDSALADDVSPVFGPLGRFVLSSVGDPSAFGETTSAVGRDDRLPGVIADAEGNPPDGIPFGIVDPDTTDVEGNKDRVLAQGSTTAFLAYDGTLESVGNVVALFGTDGVAFHSNGTLVPEPGTAGFVALGLLGLATRARVRRRSRLAGLAFLRSRLRLAARRLRRLPSRGPASARLGLAARRLRRLASAKGGHHGFGEEAGGRAGVAAEELDREEGAAELHVALDALDHALGRAPDPVLLERAAEMPSVDLLRLLEVRARLLVGLGDHDDALLRHFERVEVAPDLVAAPPPDLAAELRLEGRHVVPHVRVACRDAHQHALAAASDQDRRAPRAAAGSWPRGSGSGGPRSSRRPASRAAS
jgi:hypothetical protein